MNKNNTRKNKKFQNMTSKQKHKHKNIKKQMNLKYISYNQEHFHPS